MSGVRGRFAAAWRVLALCVALALGCSLVPQAVLAQVPRASLPDIEDEVMCPICGTTLELSDSPQAQRERELIRRLIAQGQSKEGIKRALVAEYGEDVLAAPGTKGFDLSAWVVPAVGIALAAAGVALALVRLRRQPREPDPAEGLDPSDAARLERDISSYEL